MRQRRHEYEHGRRFTIVSTVILPLAFLTLVPVMAIRRRAGAARASGGAAWRHPESMTANLAADTEEYLAWLADHHWPEDKKHNHKHSKQHEIDPFDVRPVCPGCRQPGHDVW